MLIASVPSLDTPVCAIETKRFSEEISKLGPDVACLVVSLDLPFAQKRWCGAEAVENIVTGSDYKYRSFGEDFGVYIQDMGLLARAIFLADKEGKIQHVEYIPDISEEPNYQAVLSKITT